MEGNTVDYSKTSVTMSMVGLGCSVEAKIYDHCCIRKQCRKTNKHFLNAI